MLAAVLHEPKLIRIDEVNRCTRPRRYEYA